MQYLLSEDEYDSLLLSIKEKKDKLKDTLQDLCTKVCNHMPVHDNGITEKLNPWGCVLTLEEEWYCDQCPVQDVCPNPNKYWSK